MKIVNNKSHLARSGFVAAALTGLMLAGCASYTKSGETSDENMATSGGECHGINACAGHGACGGEGHSCAGKNSCKGKGWVKMDKAECDKKGGTFKE